ncbi:14702_t:CDS:1, partial [Gigaspora margarita]
FESVKNSIDNENQSKDKENQNDVEFIFSCSVNINELEDNSKEKAYHIIEIISDIDEYK